jgi:uncharacterized protein YecE (DUF72 family)
MEATFYVGTCGYSYAEWRELFYPKDLRQAEYLRFYSLVFPFVEVDYSWYAMPKPETMIAMAAQTPTEFLFSLKAYRGLTHEIGPDWTKDAQRFSFAAEALRSRGKLAAVLIQLPYSYAYTAENRSYLGQLCDALSPFPLVVEFRNSAWYKESVFEELQKRKICLAMLDRPELQGLPPETDRLTSSMVYYRLHGRNEATWWGGNVSSRYDYDYSPKELKERARMLTALSKKVERVYVAFNNHAKANAPRNARLLASDIRELSLNP